jgi:hypothetical protein
MKYAFTRAVIIPIGFGMAWIFAPPAAMAEPSGGDAKQESTNSQDTSGASDTLILRLNSKLTFDDGWKLAMLAQVPVLTESTLTFDPLGSDQVFGCRAGRGRGAIGRGRRARRLPFPERPSRLRRREAASLERQGSGRPSILAHSRISCLTYARHLCTKKAL